jgi:PAS domain S-box-containing protein
MPHRILIFEDEILLAEDLAISLTNLGYEIAGRVSSAGNALQIVEDSKPDLVLIDIKLESEMDGIEAAEQIRKRLDTPVVYLTGYAEKDILERAKVTEPYGYLAKPVSLTELRSTVETALYKHVADKLLRESEERCRTLVETAPNGIVEIDVDGTITTFNSAYCRMIGYSAEELTGKSIVDLAQNVSEKEDIENYLASLVLDQPEPNPWFGRNVTKSGNIIDVQADWNYKRDRLENAIGFIAVVTDITERRKAQEQLRESQEKYRLVVENAKEAIYVVQGNRIRFVNRFAIEQSGYTEEELLSTTFMEFVFPDDREMIHQNHVRRLRGEVAPSRYSFRILGKQRNITWVEVDPVLVTWEGDTAVLVFATDITERKNSEKALQLSEERYRQLSDVTFEGIVFHEGGKVLEANQQFCSMSGYELHELLGRQVLPLVIAPECRDFVRQQIESGYQEPYETTGLRKDGTKFPIEILARSKEFKGRTVRAVAIRDISERKRAEEERERLLLELQQALAEVKTLSGLLPICASCKKIRDDSGYWQQIEMYIRDHSEAEFTHGLCHDCAAKLYPDLLTSCPRKTEGV